MSQQILSVEAIDIDGEMEPIMTLQIGMLASDGWVLASERRTGEVRNQIGKDDRSFGIALTESKKLWHLPVEKLALCCAGGNEPRQVGSQIVSMIQAGQFNRDNTPIALKQAFAQGVPFAQFGTKPYASERVTVVFYDRSRPELWTIELPTQTILPCESWTIAGDFGNAARFLPQLFYSRRSVASLVRLAIFTLLIGHECNPTSIGGPIDVVCGDLDGNARELTESEVGTISKEWTTLDHAIAKGLGTDMNSIAPHRPKG